MGVGGVAHVDVDPLDLADVDLGPQLEGGADRGVQQSHARVRLHGDPLGLPQVAQARVDLFGVGAVTLTEDGQPAAVRALEHPLDADVARCRQRGAGQPVARGEAVLHPLDHRFEHRRHQPAQLGRGHPEGVLEPGGVQPVQRSRGRGRGEGTEDHARMPPPGQHVQAAERLTDPRAGLVPQDGAEQEARARDAAHALSGGEHRRQDQRVGVQRRQRMVVIQLEALDEAGVHHGRRRGAGRPAVPADQYGITGVIERRYALHANAGPGQLRTDQGTADAVQDQVPGPVADGGGNVVERCLGDPGGKPAGRAGRVGGGTAGGRHRGGSTGRHRGFSSSFLDGRVSCSYPAQTSPDRRQRALMSPWLLAQLASLPGSDPARCGERC